MVRIEDFKLSQISRSALQGRFKGVLRPRHTENLRPGSNPITLPSDTFRNFFRRADMKKLPQANFFLQNEYQKSFLANFYNIASKMCHYIFLKIVLQDQNYRRCWRIFYISKQGRPQMCRNIIQNTMSCAAGENFRKVCFEMLLGGASYEIFA